MIVVLKRLGTHAERVRMQRILFTMESFLKKSIEAGQQVRAILLVVPIFPQG